MTMTENKNTRVIFSGLSISDTNLRHYAVIRAHFVPCQGQTPYHLSYFFAFIKYGPIIAVSVI